jgi:sulfur-oxidizing protein SoxY
MPARTAAFSSSAHTAPAALGVALALVLAAPLAADEQSPANGAWQTMRPNLYGTRPISETGDALMSIEAPASTPDPSATPVVVHFGEALAGRVRQLRVIIDNNPSPLVTTMNFKAGLPVEEIDLRVRIDRFTSVRAIAETSDGELQMRSTWVNASGGCSAPPTSSAGGMLGDIRFRASADDKALQISVRHPNNSGFQIDPKSGDPIAPHFIAHLRLRAGSDTLVDAETGISVSENPTLRIASRQPLQAPLVFEATDIPSQQLFTATWNGPATSAGTR